MRPWHLLGEARKGEERRGARALLLLPADFVHAQLSRNKMENAGHRPTGARAMHSYHSGAALHLPQTYTPSSPCTKGKKVPLDDTAGVRAVLRPVPPVLHLVLGVQGVQEASRPWQKALLAGSSAAHAHQVAELRDGSMTWEKH